MRPTHINEIVGQQHILGKNTALHNMILSGNVPSMLLYGEPGIGKTSIASAIAGTVDIPFALLNATTSGKKDIEEVIKKAKIDGPTILAVDEIHRFTKIHQDALLKAVEEGLLTLIGMTTENPFHSVLPAIRSRCSMIKELKRLTIEEIVSLLRRALNDKDSGLGIKNIEISDDVLELIGTATNGEVRSSLNTLEMSMYATKEIDGVYKITEDVVKEFLQNKGFNHDKDGDGHYNVLSAFQNYIHSFLGVKV
jgi:putative ATPase